MRETKQKTSFFKCLPHWNVVALDSQRCYGGLLSAWNPTYAKSCAFGTVAGIFLEGRLKHSKETIKLLNCYAPYKDRETLWQQISDFELLCEDNLIIGGDLNFTLSSREVWGDLAWIDPLTNFFSNILH